MVVRRLLFILALMPMVGCHPPELSVETVVRRQREALARLPEEDRRRLISLEEPVDRTRETPTLAPGVLELQTAREIGLNANLDIHGARARLEAALTRITEARSFYFPRIGMAHNSTRTFQTPARRTRLTSPITQIPNLPDISGDTTLLDLLTTLSGSLLTGTPNLPSQNTNSFSDHSSTISASWTIFDGLAREARLMSAKHNYRAAAMSLADVERLIVQAIDSAYYQTQLGEEELRIALAAEEFSREQLADAQKQFEARKITKAGVLNFEVRVRAAQANVIAAIGLRDTGRVILAELLALPESDLPSDVTLAALGSESEEEMTQPDVNEWIDRARYSRPDLAYAQHRRNALSENVNIARAQYSPEFLLNGTYGFERTSNLEYGKDDQASALGVEMRWQLFTGGFRSSQFRRAQAELWEAETDLERTEIQVASDVRQAIVDVINAQEQVRLQAVNLESARENRRLVTTEYAAGKASLVRLNEAQRDFVQTDADLARSRIRLRQAWTDLRAAAGLYRHSSNGQLASPPIPEDEAVIQPVVD